MADDEVLLCDTTVRSRADLDLVEQCIRDARCSGGGARCSTLDTQAYMHTRTGLLQWMTAGGDEPNATTKTVYLGGGMVLRTTLLRGGAAHVRLVQRHADNDGRLPKVEPRKKRVPPADD